MTLSIDGPLQMTFTTVVIPSSTETTYEGITTTALVSYVTETITPEPSRTTTFVTETSTSTEVLVQTSTSTVYVECTAGTRVRRGRQARCAYVTLTETSGTTTVTSTVNVTSTVSYKSSLPKLPIKLQDYCMVPHTRPNSDLPFNGLHDQVASELPIPQP
ncbi:hypothetical protein Hypma_001212 [Hypsizygus marmoreus]|uniref:Uncharacterized protein n=1 Tax=Hypsizygus marmoreus TaxID=39966 RepID=A0A369J8J4_HYPMA|nr:hypothetical protein Hypma_001212 [Hypsizygus marmoreus]